MRRMPWLSSSRLATAAGTSGCQKLGQPEPESYLLSEPNSTLRQAAQT